MSKFIYNVKFISGKAKVAALVEYIATREGVEKITLAPGTEKIPATLKQKEKIEELLKMYPDSMDTFEYEDYFSNPSLKSASLLISKILEDNAENFFNSDDYIGYISNRPGVEKNIELGHGLFSDAPILSLAETKKKIKDEAKTLFTTVLSIRREDAARLNFENLDMWQKLIKKHVPTIAASYKIPLKDFRWYAAFHNEGHHPHCHMLIYSVGKAAYVNRRSISKIKSAIATDIFQGELMDLYNQQQRELELASLYTTNILTGKEKMSEEGQRSINNSIAHLAMHLQNHKGRKVYGYLSKEAKALVDDILNTLAREPDINAVYDRYLDYKDQQHLIYHSKKTLPKHKPITDDPKFKKLKNIIIKEAAFYNENFVNEFLIEDETKELDYDPPNDFDFKDEISELESESAETADEAYTFNVDEQECLPSAETSDAFTHFTECEDLLKEFFSKIFIENFGLSFFENKSAKSRYYSAKNVVYKAKDLEKRQSAINDLLKMAIAGNVFAAYDIASFMSAGVVLDKNDEFSQKIYKKVLGAFESNYESTKDNYIAYRLGKLYLYGLGCDKDISKAVKYLTPAADAGNKFAQFTLARIYEKGEGIEKDMEKAIKYYKMAADNGHPYASYYMGKFYEEGNEYINADPSLAHDYYKAAFEAFSRLAKESPSEYLFYRLGVMAMEGKGCEVDYDLAINFLKKACDDFNYYPAAFKLAQIYSDASSEYYDIHQAIKYYEIAAEKDNNDQAAYRLARIYEKGEGVEKYMEKAIKYYKIAADNGNSYAAYRLGCIYSDINYEGYDYEKAYNYFKQSYEADSNEYAKRKMDRIDNPTYFTKKYFKNDDTLQKKKKSNNPAKSIFASLLRLFDVEHSEDQNFNKHNGDILERMKRGERFNYDG